MQSSKAQFRQMVVQNQFELQAHVGGDSWLVGFSCHLVTQCDASINGANGVGLTTFGVFNCVLLFKGFNWVFFLKP